MKLIKLFFTTIFLFGNLTGYSQKFNMDAMAKHADSQYEKALSELRDMLSIPNDAIYPKYVEMNVKDMERVFGARNFTTSRLNTGGPPILLASREGEKAKRTVLFYIQVDGQPVDSSKWFQSSPYTPVLKKPNGTSYEQIAWSDVDGKLDDDWRIFARSASDAKGPIAMFLAAIDIIDQEKFGPNFNIKVVMDFEEELGSPHLPAAVIKYKEELSADMLVILDGPRHISNLPTLSFGARGITTVTLTTFGPRVPQHSGHYGNYTPNPVFKMARILGSLKDEDGRVTLPGYYDGVSISEETKRILELVPDNEEEIMKNQGIASIDNVADTYQESIQYPSLNIRGIQSAWVGDESRTIIPATAIAEIDIRLVKESDSEKLVGLLEDRIKELGFHFVEGAPTEEERMKYSNLVAMSSENSYGAFRTEYDSDIGVWLNSALTRAFGQEPIRIRTAGGSIPIAPFVTTLDIPAVAVPTVNGDNNQHSPNENLRLGNLYEGIITYLAILTEEL